MRVAGAVLSPPSPVAAPNGTKSRSRRPNSPGERVVSTSSPTTATASCFSKWTNTASPRSGPRCRVNSRRHLI